MKGSTAKTDYTTECLAWSNVKSTTNSSNFDSVKFSAFQNILDSPCFSKDYAPWVDWRSSPQMENLISPLQSLGNFETFECKFGCILTLENFILQGNLKMPQDSLKILCCGGSAILLLKWRIWIHHCAPCEIW